MRQGWEIKRLGEIGTFQRGGGFLKSDYVEDGFPCIHYGQIHTRFGVRTLSHLTCIPKQLALSKSKIAHKGDIVIAITSEDVEGSCKCTAWMGDYDVAVGGHAAIFRHNLNPAFVAYYFRGAYFQTAKTVFAHGSKVVEIKPNDIATIKIAYPSLPEQEKIVAELDCLSGIIEKKKQQLKEYDALAQSIFYEMFGNPVENEKGWEVKTLGDVCNFINGYAFKSQLFVEEGDKILRISNIQDGCVDITDAAHFDKKDYPKVDFKKYAVFPNDIVIALSGATTGKLGINKTGNTLYLNQRVAICREKNNDINHTYLLFYLMKQSASFLDTAAGVAQPNLSTEQMKTYLIGMPPLPIQQEFASKIEAIEKQKELIKQSIAETEILFNSRMDYYFN